MENIIELEVINKSISAKFRQNNYVSNGDVYKFNFSSAWEKFLGENARLQATYLIENGRQDIYYYDLLKDYKSKAPEELFKEENEGKTVYLGVCGVHEDGTIYPSAYYRLGTIYL